MGSATTGLTESLIQQTSSKIGINNATPYSKADAYFAGGGIEKCAGITGEVAAFVADLLYDEMTKRKQIGR